MLLAAMLVDALHPALEDRKEALDGVRMGIAAHPFLGTMINAFVAGEALADTAVLVRLVGHQGASLIGMGENDRMQVAGLDTINVERPSAPAALNQRQHGPPITIASLLQPATLIVELPSGALLFVADEGFVDFQGFALAAHRGEHISKRGHRLTDA